MYYVAYNPMTEEKLTFNTGNAMADWFKIPRQTIYYWLREGKPVLELMSHEVERGMYDKAKKAQAKLKGFEIYNSKEWEE
jgi:hypothetical protein